MASIEDVEHRHRWMYYEKELPDMVADEKQKLELVQKLQQKLPHDSDVDLLFQEINYAYKWKNECLTMMKSGQSKVISSEKCAMYEDLLLGRVVITDDVDSICDALGLQSSLCVWKVKGVAEVRYRHLVNKVFDFPGIFYDHYPSETDKDDNTSLDLEGFAVQLNNKKK